MAKKVAKKVAKKTKVKPTYLEGNKPVKIAVHDVMKFLQMIDDHKHTEKFATAAKRKKAFMTVHPETVNFVKDFVANNEMHDHPTGKHIVNARGKSGDIYDCDFGKH